MICFGKGGINMKNAILAISEKKEILKQIRKELAEKYEVITFNNLLDAIDMVRESDFDLILLDNALEGISVGEAKKKLTSIGKDFITVALVDTINEETTKELENSGIFAYLLKPIKVEDLDAIILPSLNGLELIKENKRLEEKLAVLEEDTDIIGQSVKIKDVRNLIEKIADNDLPVLIVGETGTGKDIIAKEIHKKSERNKGRYAQISCALYPGELIERELFGYERGAFMGANASKKGLLEEIDGGTIYIEDVSKMDIKIQSRFLKAIEYGEFKRVGGTKVRKSNVRFLVGTDIDLKQELFVALSGSISDAGLGKLSEKLENSLKDAKKVLRKSANEYHSAVRSRRSTFYQNYIKTNMKKNQVKTRQLQRKFFGANVLRSVGSNLVQEGTRRFIKRK